MVQFLVRKSEIADIAAIVDIARECCLSPWPESDLKDELSRSGSIMLSLIMADRNIGGFLTARMVPSPVVEDATDAEIYNLGVKKQFRRLGGAQMLINELYKISEFVGVRNIWLDVRQSNTGAIWFYQKQGFVDVAIRPGFYGNPVENGVIMKRSL